VSDFDGDGRQCGFCFVMLVGGEAAAVVTAGRRMLLSQGVHTL